MSKDDRTIRIILATAGMDGHDRAILLLRGILEDNGYEVFYFGVHFPIDQVVKIAFEEGVDLIGISSHNAIHLACMEQIRDIVNSLIPQQIEVHKKLCPRLLLAE